MRIKIHAMKSTAYSVMSIASRKTKIVIDGNIYLFYFVLTVAHAPRREKEGIGIKREDEYKHQIHDQPVEIAYLYRLLGNALRRRAYFLAGRSRKRTKCLIHSFSLHAFRSLGRGRCG